MSPRDYIPYCERLASALACLLPQEQRDALREDKVGSQFILNLFQFDHIVLHAQGGGDNWWNLDPKQIAEHREKSKRDTAIVAKSKRIRRKEEAHSARVGASTDSFADLDRAMRFLARKRRIPSRPFSSNKRKLRSNKIGN